MIEDSRTHRWLVAALALVGVMLALFANHLGAGLSPDSAGYIAAARSLASGNGIRWINEEVITFWPPLYPAVIALTSLVTGIDTLSCARGLNAVVFGLIIYVSGILFTDYIRSSRAHALLGTATVLISTPVFSVCTMVWSEPLFLLFVLCHLVSLRKYLHHPVGKWFVLVVSSTALACLTRYIGLTLVLSGALALMVLGRASLKKRLFECLFFGLASTLPVVLWLLRNYTQAGTLTGPRTLTEGNRAIQILAQALYTIDAWFIPTRLLGHHPSDLLLVSLGALLLLAFGLLWWCSAWHGARSVLPVLVFAVIYFAFLPPAEHPEYRAQKKCY